MNNVYSELLRENPYGFPAISVPPIIGKPVAGLISSVSTGAEAADRGLSIIQQMTPQNKNQMGIWAVENKKYPTHTAVQKSKNRHFNSLCLGLKNTARKIRWYKGAEEKAMAARIKHKLLKIKTAVLSPLKAWVRWLSMDVVNISTKP